MKLSIMLLFMLISSNAFAHPIDMNILAQIESSSNPDAVSYRGAKYGRGLYQISEIALKHFNVGHRQIMARASHDTVMWRTLHRAENYANSHNFTGNDLFVPTINKIVANWYLDWIHERTGNEIHTLVCWNWGYGNWRKWYRSDGKFRNLPKETRGFLKKYEQLGGEL